jgi:transcriptional regulator with XRE-family HTH domain
MTPADFIALHDRLGISRAELCRRLGIAPNTGTAYALGRQRIPLTVALACAAVAFNLPPYRNQP